MIDKQQFNESMFKLHQSIYHFEQLELAKFGLNWNEILVLQLIRNKDMILAGEICIQMNQPAFVISRLLKKLYEKDFISKLPNEQDKRKHHLTLTKAGKSQLDNIESFHYKTIVEDNSDIDEGTIIAFLILTGQLDQILKLNQIHKPERSQNEPIS